MYKARRILVLGSGGAGKTTFSNHLSAITGLPVYHLDALYWGPGWTKPVLDDWISNVEKLSECEEWIIDGSYAGTLDIRVPRADLIIFLDIPRWICLKNILIRRLKYAHFTGKSRPGLPAGCKEQIYGSFLKWVWSYRQKEKPRVIAKLEALKSENTPLIICKNYQELYALRIEAAHKSYILFEQAN